MTDQLIKKTVWKQTFYVETTPYALHIVNSIDMFEGECELLDEYLINGTPANFVTPDDIDALSKMHR